MFIIFLSSFLNTTFQWLAQLCAGASGILLPLVQATEDDGKMTRVLEEGTVAASGSGGRTEAGKVCGED